MGKQKYRRLKLHVPASHDKNTQETSSGKVEPSNTPLPIECKDDIFRGIDFTNLLKDYPSKNNDDTLSLKSYISNKSVKGDKVMSKKEKLRLRREMLLKKIDTVNQLKKEHQQKAKKRKHPINGDIKTLDNLPSLESLFKSKEKYKNKPEVDITKKPKKAIEKSKKSQKKIIQNISIYKNLLKNPALVKNPFGAISEHLKAVVGEEKRLVKK